MFHKYCKSYLAYALINCLHDQDIMSLSHLASVGCQISHTTISNHPVHFQPYLPSTMQKVFASKYHKSSKIRLLLFVCYFEAKVHGEGVFARDRVFSLSQLYTSTNILRDREHSSQSLCLQSCVIFLKKLLVECEVHCSYPKEQNDHWPIAMRNMLVLPAEEW